MRGTIVGLILVLLAVTIFALSNTGPVDVRFWQWTIFSGSLALAIVGAGVIGALLTLLPALLRHSHLGWRIRDLERQLRAHGEAQGTTGPPPGSGPESGGGPGQPPGRVEDTRRFP